jgi:hypothetical protein
VAPLVIRRSQCLNRKLCAHPHTNAHQSQSPGPAWKECDFYASHLIRAVSLAGEPKIIHFHHRHDMSQITFVDFTSRCNEETDPRRGFLAESRRDVHLLDSSLASHPRILSFRREATHWIKFLSVFTTAWRIHISPAEIWIIPDMMHRGQVTTYKTSVSLSNALACMTRLSPFHEGKITTGTPISLTVIPTLAAIAAVPSKWNTRIQRSFCAKQIITPARPKYRPCRRQRACRVRLPFP